MTPSQSERISTQLATLAEQLAGVRRDIGRQDQAFELERQESHLSRKELHEKVNAVVEDMGTLGSTVKVAAEITAQTRETVKDLSDRFDVAAPTIAQMEQAKKFGQWILGGGFVAAAGTALAVFAWGETFKAWLAHWLGIK